MNTTPSPEERTQEIAAPLPPRLGRYRIEAELGRGAMGVVYRGVDEDLQRTAAIKTILLPNDPAERATHEARFVQEAKAAGAISHPNIITIYELGREGGLLFLAMELLAGRELRDWIRAGPVPLPALLDVMVQVANGLAAAHQRGVIHRDIKPSNIMVCADGRAKLMDFGIARTGMSDVKTQTGLILGSPKYMSPEQVTSAPIDHRTDIFSLGAVLYEAATGKAPFNGADIGGLMFEIANADPVAPSQLNPELPAMFDLIVAKATRKDPQARYQGAGELAADLGMLAASLSIPLQAPSAAFEATMKISTAGAADATQKTVAAAPRDERRHVPGLAMPVSRRHDSSRALERLASASPAEPAAQPALATLMRDRQRLLPWGVVLGALLAGLLIGFA
ncbi:MAG TPA: serine/threonine-protein kinase [Usitatibacteraceae bacterium]|nr:serine/threonine-protein kinase [Usitatibacteraceae bacterium]